MISFDTITKYGFFILLVVVILFITLDNRSESDKLYIDTLEKNLRALEDEVGVLKDRNFVLQTKNKELMKDIEYLDRELTAIENKRKQAIKYYEKRLKDIRNLNVNELSEYFTERYGQPGDSTQANRD